MDADLATTSRPVRVDDMLQNISRQVEPTCAFLPDGRMFVAWSDDRISFQGDFDLYGAVSNATVTSFGTKRQARRRPAGEITHQILPHAVADAEGNIYLSFADDRDFRYSIYYARVLANTTDLTTAAKKPPGGRCANDDLLPGQTLAMAPDGALYLAWMGDGYTAKLAFARAYAAGADRAPSCLLNVPASVSAADAPFKRQRRSPGLWTACQRSLTRRCRWTAAPLTTTKDCLFLGRGRPGSLSVGEHTVNASVTDRTGATGACSAMFTVTAATTSTNHAPSVWNQRPR